MVLLYKLVVIVSNHLTYTLLFPHKKLSYRVCISFALQCITISELMCYIYHYIYVCMSKLFILSSFLALIMYANTRNRLDILKRCNVTCRSFYLFFLFLAMFHHEKPTFCDVKFVFILHAIVIVVV